MDSIDITDNSDCDCDHDDWPDDYMDLAPAHINPIYPRPEVKAIDIGVGGTPAITTVALSSSGVVAALNDDIVAGTGLSQATGNQYTVVSLSYNFCHVPLTTGVFTRISFVWDLQSNGATAAFTDIFNAPGSPIAANAFSHLNLNNRQRFLILRTFVYPAPANGSVNYETGKIKINMRTTFTSGQSTATPVRTGALLFVGVSSGTPQVTGRLRIRYIDN